MQRLESAGLLGTMPPAPPVPPVVDSSLSTVVPRAADVRSRTSAPTRSLPGRVASRPPLESRPAGAQLGQVRTGTPVRQSRGLQGFLMVTQRLKAGDPVLIEQMRRNPAELRRLRDFADRLMRELSC